MHRLNIGIKDNGKFFDVMKFLMSNKTIIANEMRYHLNWQDVNVDKQILSLLKEIVIKHFPLLTIEEITIILDRPMLNIYFNNYWFNQDSYRPLQ